jgi:molybdopterin converting factor small subunit
MDAGDRSETVTIRLPQALSEYAGGRRELALDCGSSSSLGEVLDQLARSNPAVERRIRDETGQIRRFVNVYVGEDECRTLDGLLTELRPGATVFVVGSVAGG